MRTALAVLALTALAGCASVEPTGGVPMPLINSSGQTIGSVRAWEAHGSVSFRVSATGMPHGLHGIHVHAVGRCDPPDFASAGPHWNPWGMKHGMNNLAGPHAGDLPNVAVSANGVLDAIVTLSATSMDKLVDHDGAAIVIHAQFDNYETDPDGGSGARIACAVIRPVAEQR
ncbi:MAG TPA: superoxide dismutase family protein [Sphingomicrobium sp.]|jgi:Cu-Zn family superoxide dismutase|nr:superoxide dismutase family protein [Sphingomicrobium sp.]